MEQEHIFISHSSKNDGFVKKLRQTLELFGELSWVDSRELRGGDRLNSVIQENIRNAKYILIVVSLDALNSEWVQDELAFALKEEKKRSDGFKVISVILPGVQLGILRGFFPKDFLHIFLEDKLTGFSEAMPKISAALG